MNALLRMTFSVPDLLSAAKLHLLLALRTEGSQLRTSQLKEKGFLFIDLPMSEEIVWFITQQSTSVPSQMTLDYTNASQDQ
jgi:hypothetical protein